MIKNRVDTVMEKPGKLLEIVKRLFPGVESL